MGASLAMALQMLTMLIVNFPAIAADIKLISSLIDNAIKGTDVTPEQMESAKQFYLASYNKLMADIQAKKTIVSV